MFLFRFFDGFCGRLPSVDENDRLWVQRGTVRTPFLDVFDLDGNHLFTAGVEPSEQFEDVALFATSGGGFLGFNPDPDDYPKLYIFQLEEAANPIPE